VFASINRPGCRDRAANMGKDMRQLAVLFCALSIASCGNASKTADDSGYLIVGQDRIKSRLRDPESAQFSGLQVSRKSGVVAICGMVNSKNGFGGMSGPQRFITGGATAIEGDGTMDAANFQQSWDMMC